MSVLTILVSGLLLLFFCFMTTYLYLSKSALDSLQYFPSCPLTAFSPYHLAQQRLKKAKYKEGFSFTLKHPI